MVETMPPGPIMLDVAGRRLTEEESATLRHPLVGAVILFSRNFESVAQLIDLTTEIHALRHPLLIAVDHEGGRVQRFRTGFTAIPPMRSLGRLWDTDPDAANEMARAAGYVLAAELRACGVDFSFTPVLDLDYGRSQVIGDRAFHRDPRAVTELARALISGLRRGGMANCGKHFPGHGFVAADSHHAIPYDPRPARDLAEDLAPYRAHHRIDLSAVMPAHVIYEKVAPQPAGFSPVWLQQTLRGEIGFDGVIFSDDLCMEGACVAGDIVARAEAARRAGCDMVLVCNNPEAARRLLSEWRPAPDPRSAQRIASLFPAARPEGRDGLSQDAAYRSSVHLLSTLAGG